MHLYLVQHGEAVPETEDPERPLTDLGRADIQRLAEFLSSRGISAERVIHSTKSRSRDSAQILKDAIAPAAVFEKHDKILPKDSTEWLTESLSGWRGDTVVVGHQPFMSRFVSRLVLGKESPLIVDFTPGTLVCLDQRSATGAWFLAWMISPRLLRS